MTAVLLAFGLVIIALAWACCCLAWWNVDTKFQIVGFFVPHCEDIPIDGEFDTIDAAAKAAEQWISSRGPDYAVYVILRNGARCIVRRKESIAGGYWCQNCSRVEVSRQGTFCPKCLERHPPRVPQTDVKGTGGIEVDQLAEMPVKQGPAGKPN